MQLQKGSAVRYNRRLQQVSAVTRLQQQVACAMPLHVHLSHTQIVTITLPQSHSYLVSSNTAEVTSSCMEIMDGWHTDAHISSIIVTP